MDIIKNPNKQIYDNIKKSVEENDGYCPCTIVKSKDTKCMCKDFKEKIKNGEPGECHCGLYAIVED